MKDISFTIDKGEVVALVGETGAGKSSIINLLYRFYDPQKGQILIDGRDIRKLHPDTLRQKMGLVLQDIFLFPGTLLDNLRFFEKSIDEKNVMQSISSIGMDDFVNNCEEGLNSVVSERGANFSTGQQQLISFARALIFNPQILILDEATSAIDPETEKKIQRAMQYLLTGRTSLIVAHRLSTIKNADKILVLHKGILEETGTHQQLLQKRNYYYQLCKLQYGTDNLESWL